MGTELYQGPDRDDVRQRLGGTVCRYKNKPVYIIDTRYPHMVAVQHLGDMGGDYEWIDYRTPDFDYKSPPLGYMNLQGKAYYLSRLPWRDIQKQGLTQEAIESKPDLRRGWFPSAALGKCILGEHPNLQEALEQIINQGHESVAIHRHIAVGQVSGQNLGVFYRGRLVGIRERGVFRLLQSEETSILERLIRKAGVNIC
jgi:hypothetical protein